MSMSGISTETISAMEESVFQTLPNGCKITTATATSVLSGDMAGECEATMIMLYDAEGHAKFHGYQTLAGSIGGRSGTTVIWFDGGYDRVTARSHFRFLPEYSTDSLAGLKGGGSVSAGHSDQADWSFEYSFLTD